MLGGKAFSTGSRKVLLALAAGPLLGVLVFLAVTSGVPTPPAAPETAASMSRGTGARGSSPWR